MTHLLIINWSVQNILPCEHMDHGNMGCLIHECNNFKEKQKQQNLKFGKVNLQIYGHKTRKNFDKWVESFMVPQSLFWSLLMHVGLFVKFTSGGWSRVIVKECLGTSKRGVVCCVRGSIQSKVIVVQNQECCDSSYIEGADFLATIPTSLILFLWTALAKQRLPPPPLLSVTHDPQKQKWKYLVDEIGNNMLTLPFTSYRLAPKFCLWQAFLKLNVWWIKRYWCGLELHLTELKDLAHFI